MIAQFLLTRFNVPIHQRPGTNLDPDWLTHRLNLFRRYCLPSVQQQIWKDFRWLIAVDDRTPPPVLKELLSCELPALCNLILIRPNEEFQQRLRSAMALMLPNGAANYVISTRMDNDDAIMPGYLGLVRKAAMLMVERNPVAPAFVDAPKGHTYEVERDVFRPRSYVEHATALSPFLSLVEPFKERLWTAFCGDHGHLREKFPKWPVFQLDTAQWVQVLHGRNVANAIGAGEPYMRSTGEAFKRSLGWWYDVRD